MGLVKGEAADSGRAHNCNCRKGGWGNWRSSVPSEYCQVPLLSRLGRQASDNPSLGVDTPPPGTTTMVPATATRQARPPERGSGPERSRQAAAMAGRAVPVDAQPDPQLRPDGSAGLALAHLAARPAARAASTARQLSK